MESLSMCTPVITAPWLQTVPALTAGILRTLDLPANQEDWLVATTKEDYVFKVVTLLGGAKPIVSELLQTIRHSICHSSHRIFEHQDSAQEWNLFLSNIA